MHRSYGLQGSLKRRCKHPSPTSINGYHAAKKLLSQSPAKRPTFAFAGESGYTHSPSPTGSHTAAYTPKQGRFGWGRYYYPRSISHVSETLRGQGAERRTLPLLRLDPVCSRRTQRAFGSTPGQAPKAAKFAVLNPGHAGFPKRVERSEGSDTTPIRNVPCFGVQAAVCDPSPKAECVPAFTRESERRPFVPEVLKAV